MKYIFFALLFACSAQAETLNGVAKSADGQVLYREVHEVTRSTSGAATAISTTYFKPSGEKFAVLASDFTRDPYLPDSRFEDLRFRRVFESKLTTASGQRRYQISERRDDRVQKTSVIEIEGPAVCNQGFDNFVSSKLLIDAETAATVQFIVPPRHDAFRFEIQKGKSASADTSEFLVRPRSSLIRLFVDDIKLVYSRTTRRLLRYEGLSNLPDDRDRSQSVVISYESDSKNLARAEKK